MATHSKHMFFVQFSILLRAIAELRSYLPGKYLCKSPAWKKSSIILCRFKNAPIYGHFSLYTKVLWTCKNAVKSLNKRVRE